MGGGSQLYTNQTICTFLMLKGFSTSLCGPPKDYPTPCSS